MPIDVLHLIKACERSVSPLLGELFECVTFKVEGSHADEYLRAFPELRQSLEGLAQGARRDFHEIQLAAYYRFKEREQGGEQPLHGRDVEDWLSAEVAYGREPQSDRQVA